jgi:iron complex transport system substrate-binding protein
MIKNIRNFSILFAFVLLLSACETRTFQDPTSPAALEPAETVFPAVPSAESPAEPIFAVDDLGAEIVLDGPAQKIISISPSLTEILYGIGAGDRLIGRDSNSTFPEAALSAADLGGMWDGIPVEDILALEPDLILAGEIFAEEAILELRELGLVVFWQENPNDFEELFENIREIALLVGTEDTAEDLINSLSERVAALDEKLAGVDDLPLVFYELDASDPANPYTPGADTFISIIISRAKGVNLGDSLEGEWVQVSSEELLAQNPDVILLADALYGISPDDVAQRPGWTEIKAVEAGEIYPFDPFILSVPGPRLVDGFEQVAEILHPEVFEK